MKSGRLIPQLGMLGAVGLLLFSHPVALGKDIRLRTVSISTAKTAAPLSANKSAVTAPVSGLFLIQFTGPLQSEWRAELAALGVDLLTYVPDDAFVARLQNVSPAAVRELKFIQWLGDFRAEYKLHPALQSGALRFAVGPTVAVNVLLAPRISAAELAAARQLFVKPPQLSAHRFGAILYGQVAAPQIGALADSGAVLWLEPAAKMKLLDEVAAKIVAGAGGPNQTLTQTLGYTGTNVIVAVADSGLDTGDTNAMHPDLAGRVTGLLYYGSLASAADELGHGTSVAGALAGNGATGETDGDGALYGLGVAPGASVLVQRVFDADGDSQFPDYATLTEDAVTNGAAIGLNSWGHDSTGGLYDLAAATFDELVRDADTNSPGDQPFILVFAAGNEGFLGPANILSPAVGKNVLAIGASQSARTNFPDFTDGPEVIANFSSVGPSADGRIKPDLVAPGTWIASAWSSVAPPLASDVGQDMIDTNYAYLSGTSLAAPQVSGAAAVFVQYYRATHANATPSPALVKAALINSAHDLDVMQGNAPTPNMTEGWGRVNVAGLFATNQVYDYQDQSVCLTNSQIWSRPVIVQGSNQPLKITLAYTDVPGTPLAARALVNDLDLVLTAPDGHVYRGNQFDGNGVSVPDATNSDCLNNVEGLNLPAPPPGIYTLSVCARSVVADFDGATNSEPRQDFALVISGNTLPGVAGLTGNFSVGHAIPDGSPVGLVDTKTVSTPIHSLADIKVRLKIAGKYNGDLYCYLVHNSRFTVLLNRVGRRAGDAYGYGDAGLDVTFDPAATNSDVHVYRLKLNGNNNVPLVGALTGSWVPDGRNISPAQVLATDPQNASLNSFLGVDPNGQWTIFVADLVGGDTNALVSWGLDLIGTMGPNIIQQPTNKIVQCSSGNASFSVLATNSLALNYQWYFNSALIAGATASILIVTNADLADTGNYSVTISAVNGSINSAVATLTVIDTLPPTVTILGANPQTVALHGTFTDAGATANDTCAGALPVNTNGTVNLNAVGAYLIRYSATDPGGNSATNSRTVNVVNVTPVITSFHLAGSNFVVNGSGAASYSYGLLAVTNLVPGVNWMTNWATIANTMSDSNGLFQLIDPNANASSRRFYRVGSP